MSQSFTDISVHLLARPRVDRVVIRAWLDELGAYRFRVPDESELPDAALLVAVAAKQCYLAFEAGLNPNVTRVREDLVAYLDNILASGHGSVLEHATYTFAINGCSRVFTGEMNRHRAGVAISERSMRYIRYDLVTYWLPECLRDAPEDNEAIRAKKRASRAVMEVMFNRMEWAMGEFASIWAEELAPASTFHAKKTLTSAFRRVIGMGIATGGIWTLNVRALRHVLALRTDPAAEEEIVHVTRKIGALMMRELAAIFADFAVTERGAYVPKYPKV